MWQQINLSAGIESSTIVNSTPKRWVFSIPAADWYENFQFSLWQKDRYTYHVLMLALTDLGAHHQTWDHSSQKNESRRNHRMCIKRQQTYHHVQTPKNATKYVWFRSAGAAEARCVGCDRRVYFGRSSSSAWSIGWMERWYKILPRGTETGLCTFLSWPVYSSWNSETNAVHGGYTPLSSMKSRVRSSLTGIQ